MIEIVVLSGKGGAGKTTVTSCLSALIEDKLICDCDVEGANLHLSLQGQITQKHTVYLTKTAHINSQLCSNCGLCSKVCRFNAIKTTDSSYCILSAKCEGCKTCTVICPCKAIEMKSQPTGQIILKDTEYGQLFYAELFPGRGNSGKLVSELKEKANAQALKLKKPILIIDGPPGIACPTISSLTGADLVILVIESSISGIQDAQRLFLLSKQFKIKTLAIINKYGICPPSDNQAKAFLEKNSIPLLGIIPFKKEISQYQIKGKIPLKYFPREIFENLLYHINYGEIQKNHSSR